MKRALLALGLVLAVASPTLAQQAQPQPCTRGQSTVKMPGPDLDEVKCLLAVDDQRIAELDKQLRQTEADRVMAHNDLSAAQKAAEQREKELHVWFGGYFGEAKPAE